MFLQQIVVKQPHPVTLLKTDLFPWNFGTNIPHPERLYIYHILHNFRGLVRHIENKNQSVRSNFAALKNSIMLNVSLTKTEQNTQGVLSPAPQSYAKINKLSEG